MATSKRGKQFEQQVQDGLEKIPGMMVFRLKDRMSGWYGDDNPCDFFAYKYPKLITFECKETKDSTLNFKSDISENQWDGLLKMAQYPGVISGYFVWFLSYDITLFVPAKTLLYLRENGAKSLNVHNLPLQAFKISGKKRRILFDYDFTEFVDKFLNYTIF